MTTPPPPARRPQECDAAKPSTDEEKVDVSAQVELGAEAWHGMEVMMRAGSTGFGIGLGYHFSFKVEATLTGSLSPKEKQLRPVDGKSPTKACGDISDAGQGCRECLQHYTTLKWRRIGYGDKGETGDHHCRWWKTGTGHGYCSMWDHFSRAMEISEDSDCNLPFEAREE